MARAGRACWPATRGAELSTSRENDVRRRRELDGRRTGVDDDGGAAETSSTGGRGWSTEARSKMAVAAAMIDV